MEVNQKTGLVAVAINACKLASQHVPEDEVQDLELTINKLEVMLVQITSHKYECPRCIYMGRRGDDVGQLTLDFDIESDDMGYRVSSWPYLTGTCEDPPLPEGFTVSLYDRTTPRSHAMAINRECEDGTLSSDMERVLGTHVERKRLREVLGVR